MKADTLILGNIMTLDAVNSTAEAVAVRGGTVKYVGSRAIAEQLCAEDAKVIDYGDKYVYPGFMDAHCHGSMAGVRLKYEAVLNSGQTMEEYVQLMKQFMDKHPDNDTYWGAGWQDRDVPPTAAMLDAICRDKPMAINSVDGHSVWMNTKGMEYFGINEDSVTEWGTDIIRVDEAGKPIGRISEGPTNSIIQKMGEMDSEKYKAALLAWQDFLLSQGITSFYEAGVTERVCRAYSELIAEGRWKLRVYAGWMVDEKLDDYTAEVRKAAEMAEKYNSEYFKITGIKIFMDGVIEADTAWLLEPYEGRPDYTGIKRMQDYDRVVEMYIEAEKYGLNVHAHTIGDGAVKFAVDCIEAAQIATGNMDMRNALAHIQMARPEDVSRICDLGVVAVVAPLWMRKEPGYYNQCVASIGPKRAFYQYPLKSFTKCGGVIAFHTDYPVSPDMSVPESIYCAEERNFPACEMYTQLNIHESIDRKEALFGLTKGPAYSVRQEARLGTLYVGSVANMSVYDRNFLTDNIDEVAAAKLVATVVDGVELYRA